MSLGPAADTHQSILDEGGRDERNLRKIAELLGWSAYHSTPLRPADDAQLWFTTRCNEWVSLDPGPAILVKACF